MNEKARISIGARGYYLNHLDKTAKSVPMRIEANLGYASLPSGAEPTPPAVNDAVWIRIRENTPGSSGGCEAAICLSIEEADRLHSALLDIIYYVLPERRSAGRPGPSH